MSSPEISQEDIDREESYLRFRYPDSADRPDDEDGNPIELACMRKEREKDRRSAEEQGITLEEYYRRRDQQIYEEECTERFEQDTDDQEVFRTGGSSNLSSTDQPEGIDGVTDRLLEEGYRQQISRIVKRNKKRKRRAV